MQKKIKEANVRTIIILLGNVKELKEFYNKNKDRIHIEDEYGEEQDIDELFQFIDMKYKDKNSQSHTDAYKVDKDTSGYHTIFHKFVLKYR